VRRAREESTSLLVVGAGPFGLAMAAEATDLGIDHVVVGEPMSFWKRHMPAGMLLRSDHEWHLDPVGFHTIERFLEIRGQKPADVEPLSLELYLEYAKWFEEAKGIRVQRAHVQRLDGRDGHFVATLDDGSRVTAERVLLALGYASFAHVPDELAALIPADRSSHTLDCAAPDRFAGHRVLVVGGRQSAFETAALLAEAGTRAVHVVHRHATPAFTLSDWSWVEPTLERVMGEPGWYRSLPESEREGIRARFFAEGRLKLEPWLGPRVGHAAIALHPETRVTRAEPLGGSLRVRLDKGGAIDVDHVLYATGYKVDMTRVPLLAAGNLHAHIECRDGFPVLDESLQTSVSGLYVTSLPATRDFGLFFGFTVAVRASARLVGRALRGPR
jgi:cation diffusion facilitator CzcD-associated flavoprotein CzcO